MSNETLLREDICRFGRSLFERGLTPGSSGNISARLDGGGWLVTPTNASFGFLDPAKLSRLDDQGRLVSGDAPTKEVPLHNALYATRGSARAIVHLHSTHSVALSMLPEIDPRAALPPMTAYYLMKCGGHRARALLPPWRSRGRRCDQGSGGGIFVRAARQSRSGRRGRHAGSSRVRDRGAGGDGEAVPPAARIEPAVFVAGAGE
ncbi:ribulose-5-phosphate 4-epimerase/fuculose-1-phosphate aldolase [Bradyrhizobium sp. GM6.1]